MIRILNHLIHLFNYIIFKKIFIDILQIFNSYAREHDEQTFISKQFQTKFELTIFEEFLNAELCIDFDLILLVALLTVKLLLTDWKNDFFFLALTCSLSGLIVCSLHSPGHFHSALLKLLIRDPLFTRARRLHCSWWTCR